eukprot:CAMPEP_0113450154 /NCGR_PEP_ID=MMETSP0014_2-20120614/5676_1 /TAXON_ID=2857 /ORGANISM="Nitzschia sp." /LENGTH=1277 /DNA_ID=CAMNT_0000341469 /DNA_START=205 /DNA_END=4039 /DNA_ORIENTATION=- /assembly_acc=CAM_ASM_000159
MPSSGTTSKVDKDADADMSMSTSAAAAVAMTMDESSFLHQQQQQQFTGGLARPPPTFGRPTLHRQLQHGHRHHHQQQQQHTSTVRSRLFDEEDDDSSGRNNNNNDNVNDKMNNDIKSSSSRQQQQEEEDHHLLLPPPNTTLRNRNYHHHRHHHRHHQHHNHTSSSNNNTNKPYVLKPLSLNLDFEEVQSQSGGGGAAAVATTASPPPPAAATAAARTNNTTTNFNTSASFSSSKLASSFSSSSNESSPDQHFGNSGATTPHTQRRQRKKRHPETETHDLYAGRSLSFEHEEQQQQQRLQHQQQQQYQGTPKRRLRQAVTTTKADNKRPSSTFNVESPVDNMIYASPQTSPSSSSSLHNNNNNKFYRSPSSSKFDHRTPIRVQRRPAAAGGGGGLPPPAYPTSSSATMTPRFYNNASKSPRFRTLDGRIVESKNPFSPMMMYSTDGSNTSAGSNSSTSGNNGNGVSAGTCNDTPTASIMAARMANVNLGPDIHPSLSSTSGNNGNGGGAGTCNDTPTASIMAARMANVNLGPGHSPVPPPMLSLEELKQKGTTGYFYNSHLLLRQKLQKRTAIPAAATTDGGGNADDHKHSPSTMLMSDCTINSSTCSSSATPGNNKTAINNDNMDVMNTSPDDRDQPSATAATAATANGADGGLQSATLAVNALSAAASAKGSTTEVDLNDDGNVNQFSTSTWYTIRDDGYPEQTGQYSFTGSPIKESHNEHSAFPLLSRSVLRSPSGSSNDSGNEFFSMGRQSLEPHQHQQQKQQQSVCTNIHKVRRRSKEQDVAAAVAAAEDQGMSSKQKTNRRTGGLFVATSSADGDIDCDGDDNISPTDVLSFPVLHASPSDTTTVPPAPCKKKPLRRPPVKRYTPIRTPIAPPQTPMNERHKHVQQRRLERSSSFEGEDDFMDDSDMNTPPSNRSPRLDFSSGDPSHYNQRPILPDSRSMSTAPASSGSSRFYSDFDVIAELGNGSFGNVFKVLSKVDGCMYAIKVAHRPAKGNADRDRMLKEVYALAALGNQSDTATFHIVRYHQAWLEDQRLYIQTELCTTTLQAELKQAAPAALPIERQYKCLREILLALEFIHKNGLCHLDIKPENIFLKNDQFKLGDFGLVSKTSSHDVEEGDSRYMSMELLSGDHADLTKSDIFSLGMTMYEVSLGGNKVLPSNGPEWQALRSTGAPLLPGVPPELYDIIQQMLRHNFQERPSAHDLLQRPQLLSEDQKMLLRERNKVMQANMALVEQRNKMRDQNTASTGASGTAALPPMPRRTVLTRANTWNGF